MSFPKLLVTNALDSLDRFSSDVRSYALSLWSMYLKLAYVEIVDIDGQQTDWGLNSLNLDRGFAHKRVTIFRSNIDQYWGRNKHRLDAAIQVKI